MGVRAGVEQALDEARRDLFGRARAARPVLVVLKAELNRDMDGRLIVRGDFDLVGPAPGGVFFEGDTDGGHRGAPARHRRGRER